MTEEQVLTAIKRLAIREENTMVARVTLHNMRQERDKPIRMFGARVRGQASICKFQTQCTNCEANVDYTETMLRDVLCRGLEDTEIQMDLLSDKNQDMSLEQALTLIEIKEAGKRSAAQLLVPQSTDATTNSSYRKQKRPRQQASPPSDQGICTYCGTKGHGRNPTTRVRRLECPAFGTKCTYCGKDHHLEKLCRKKDRTQHPKNVDHENIISDTLCGLTSAKPVGSVTLDHHIFDASTHKWYQRPSMPQPYVRLKASVESKDYKQFGYTLNTITQHTFVSAMADTGCQSCLAGLRILKKMGLSTGDLLPVTLKMSAEDNRDIPILGATILRLSAMSNKGEPISTKQIVYITKHTNKLFLSREACADLGIIPRQFPSINKTEEPGQSSSINVANTSQEKCSCPKRTQPPPIPTSLPYPATEENRTKVRQYLLDLYRSSTFNTCEHQKLPLMDGPPMRLMIDSTATPTAYHTPIPVPLHWQEEVKAGLDRDVRLGVIEPVPIGEPVTWCHRMVICAKKTGKPRRTIDFQPLNTYATRETHHTQSPFHQVRSVPNGKKKTVFDAWNGYHSVPLHPDDRHYTTFVTPWGRYRYCTAPQGYIASGDGYTRRYDEITSSIPNKTKCVDDTLLWADTIEESFYQAAHWLDIWPTWNHTQS